MSSTTTNSVATTKSPCRPDCDLFCRVIDNFGDAGVAWRLARRLTQLGQKVRLWIDQSAVLERIRDNTRVEVHTWNDDFPPVEPAGRIIELFGAKLPENYRAAMVRLEPKPIWINLEYLSCENWVAGFHGLPSLHPPLSKVFFFPGVTPGTGGVVLEPDLLVEWEHFDRTAFLGRLGIPANDRRLYSLFSYDTPALESLITGLIQQTHPVRLVTFVTPALPRIASILGRSNLSAGDRLVQGALELRVVPWLSQDDYDRLLWSCDFNIVRGEDSFVRAQLAGKPLLWQPYVQNEATHLIKLEAFLTHYSQGLATADALAVRAAHNAFNRGKFMPLPEDSRSLEVHARLWRAQILARGDLGEHLLAQT